MIEALSEPYVRTIGINMPNRLGFQLRLAAQFAQCMQEFHSTIQVRKGEVLADGKNILELLILAAAWKSRLEIEAVGEDASQAIEAIEDFFSNQENISDRPLLKVDCQRIRRMMVF